MASTYRVLIRQTEWFTVDVAADTREEAYEIAMSGDNEEWKETDRLEVDFEGMWKVEE